MRGDDSGRPFWQKVFVGANHCGAGCTLGDIVSEFFILWTGWTIAGVAMYAAWISDYVVAFLFGIAFQYFTIVPMRNLSRRAGIWAAVKADWMSITAYQVGMYGWMAIARFAIFGPALEPRHPTFWFMMQLAMWCGIATTYPVNWWLLKTGRKEAM
jgi:hypothetical protein